MLTERLHFIACVSGWQHILHAYEQHILTHVPTDAPPLADAHACCLSSIQKINHNSVNM